MNKSLLFFLLMLGSYSMKIYTMESADDRDQRIANELRRNVWNTRTIGDYDNAVKAYTDFLKVHHPDWTLIIPSFEKVQINAAKKPTTGPQKSLQERLREALSHPGAGYIGRELGKGTGK